jgi:prepilin-type N-terminal cleavage/methylation domain-containing protein/prepilin-type processing-associated H-X9-DG protein
LARKTAFTLIELLVALAIVAVLVAIMFPVFNRAKAQAQASVCLNNFKQVSLSASLYAMDYDDRYALSRYTHRVDATSADDRTWVQLLMPYGREFRLYKCPSDYTQGIATQAVFDEDLVPGDTYSRYYRASKRSNLGYNYLYLSPLIQTEVFVSPLSRSQTEVNDPANMLMYGDSVHEVTPSGDPSGGGSYLIVPPCRYASIGSMVYDTFKLTDIPNSSFFVGELAWEPTAGSGGSGGSADQLREAGGLYPWHAKKLTALFVDGHVRRISLGQAAVGCNVLPMWAGYVFDRSSYLWDMD